MNTALSSDCEVLEMVDTCAFVCINSFHLQNCLCASHRGCAKHNMHQAFDTSKRSSKHLHRPFKQPYVCSTTTLALLSR